MLEEVVPWRQLGDKIGQRLCEKLCERVRDQYTLGIGILVGDRPVVRIKQELWVVKGVKGSA